MTKALLFTFEAVLAVSVLILGFSSAYLLFLGQPRVASEYDAYYASEVALQVSEVEGMYNLSYVSKIQGVCFSDCDCDGATEAEGSAIFYPNPERTQTAQSGSWWRPSYPNVSVVSTNVTLCFSPEFSGPRVVGVESNETTVVSNGTRVRINISVFNPNSSVFSGTLDFNSSLLNDSLAVSISPMSAEEFFFDIVPVGADTCAVFSFSLFNSTGFLVDYGNDSVCLERRRGFVDYRIPEYTSSGLFLVFFVLFCLTTWRVSS